ncbi:MAG: UDP-3-O-(3-hydroxymyristoyl)glucosamine N-acyltransferase [Bacteroidetes bacterium]|nr:UDP-3-O-(3-hydroxymyristoyl)glucosamine N-acyltransferase [Bacteroidota bacterium]
MEFTAEMIAAYLKGTIEGNPSVKVRTIARIEEGFEGALSFLANPKYEQYIYTTGSSVVLVNRDFVPASPVNATLVRVDDAYKAFASLLTMYEQSKPSKKGIHPTAVIEESARIGADVYIGPYVYIGENVVVGDKCSIYSHVSIGDNSRTGSGCRIYSGVRIYHDTIIGNGCTIHAGSVIGADGFGFAPQSDSEFMKVPQIGNVILEENVEIGANVCIDRATIGSTVIRRGVKLDNLIQVGHNVEIGENTVMAGQTGIAGSTKIGRNCMFAGQVGVMGHITVADGTRVGAQSGIAGAVKKPDSVIIGSPAFDYHSFMKSFVVFKKLPEMKSAIDKLEKGSK